MKMSPFTLVLCFAGAIALQASDRDLALARQNLDGLRGVQLPKGAGNQKQIDALNKKMDAAWGFFGAHKEHLPVVEEELKKAISVPESDQFFLLDVGYMLLTNEGDKAVEMALSALERINPKAEIIRSNWEELFHFVMKLGATGKFPDRYLLQMDRIYLPNEEGVNFFRAPHLVELTPDDVRSMVYGLAGEQAAQHLVSLLRTTGDARKKIIPILTVTGSELNTPAVKAVLEGARDYDTIGPCIHFLMEVGGPLGRAAVLAIDPQKVDDKTRAYLEKIRSQVEAISFAAMLSKLTELDSAKVSDEKLRQLLDKMEASNGADSETPPAAIVTSAIPRDRLLAQLKRIRARSFRQETNHVFDDLPITNLVINALQYK